MTTAERLGLIYRYQVSPTPGFDYISPEIAAVTGYSPDEFYSDPDFDLTIVHPHDREQLTAISRKPPELTNIRWICRDGSIVLLELACIPVYSEDTLVAVEGIARVVADQAEGWPESKSNGRTEPVGGSLTKRELEILELIIDGRSDSEVGMSLNISRRTVEHHLTHIRIKTGAPNTKAAIAIALKRGLTGSVGARAARK